MTKFKNKNFDKIQKKQIVTRLTNSSCEKKLKNPNCEKKHSKNLIVTRLKTSIWTKVIVTVLTEVVIVTYFSKNNLTP